MIQLKKAELQNELSIKRFLLKYEPEYANSRLIKDYYFSDTELTGILMVLDNDQIKSLAFYSIMLEKNKSFIHMWIGPIDELDSVKDELKYPCQIFLKDGVTPSLKWNNVLSVFPGKIVEHAAYSGVFSRSMPKFYGNVYECS